MIFITRLTAKKNATAGQSRDKNNSQQAPCANLAPVLLFKGFLKFFALQLKIGGGYKECS
jgi:hypothetical protein